MSVCLSVCEFAMVPGVYILLSPQEEEVYSSSWGQRYIHSAAHSSKRFKPLSTTILLWHVHCWIRKNTNKEFKCVCGTLTELYFEIPICFWFQVMSPSNLFLKFGKFLVLYLGCGQGRIQRLVWAQLCYGNVGFVYTNDTLWYIEIQAYIRSLIQYFWVFYP